MSENIIMINVEEAPEGYLEEIMSGRRTLYDWYKKPTIRGKMAYHSYTTYKAEDSEIFILDFESGEKYCINDDLEEDIKNTMNPCFNKYGTHIVFMGLYPRKYGNEWDVFIYELATKRCVNLTRDNGYSNEDPRFSPDAMHVVYKQGSWSDEVQEMTYDIWEMDFENYRTYGLVENDYTQSMPCYGEDKQTVYCSRTDPETNNGEIIKLSIRGEEIITGLISDNKDIHAYFPVYYKDKVYFSTWNSVENKMDKIIIYDEKSKLMIDPLFNSPEYNVSDAAPITDRYLVVSSTKDSSTGYKLYLADIETGLLFNLDKEYSFNTDDGRQQLGASCYITSIIEIK